MRKRAELGMGTESSRHCTRGSPPDRVRLRSALGVVAVAVAVALSGTRGARAQADTTSGPVLSSPNGDISLSPNSQGVERRPSADRQSRPWWISYEDCINDVAFAFSLATGAGASNESLEVWAGTQNCASGRNNVSTIGQCWMVAKDTVQGTAIDIEVPVRNVVSRRTGVAEIPGPLGPEVCDDSDQPNGDAINWYFMVVKGGQGDEYLAWDGGTEGTGFDVVGPTPPRAIHVGTGESQLTIEIDMPSLDSSRERYEAFCVPEGTVLDSLEQGVDAGTAVGSGRADEAGATFTCGQNVLRAGERPPTQPEFSCGTTNAVSRTLRTTRLRDDVTYAVAIAAQDEIGNAGVISEVQCGTPTRLDDFMEICSRSGCPGGGGFCSFSPRRAEGAGSVSVALLMLAALGWRRARSQLNDICGAAAAPAADRSALGR